MRSPRPVASFRRAYSAACKIVILFALALELRQAVIFWRKWELDTEQKKPEPRIDFESRGEFSDPAKDGDADGVRHYGVSPYIVVHTDGDGGLTGDRSRRPRASLDSVRQIISSSFKREMALYEPLCLYRA
jgi:hypothetical protein